MSSCPPLTPLIAVFIVVLVALYLGAPYVLWHRTMAQRLLNVVPSRESDDV